MANIVVNVVNTKGDTVRMIGTRYSARKPFNVTVNGQVLSNVMCVVSSDTHVLALTKNKLIYGIGTNTYGQLGLGNTSDKSVWTMSSITNVVNIDALTGTSLCKTADGTYYFCGQAVNVSSLGDNYKIWTTIASIGNLPNIIWLTDQKNILNSTPDQDIF